MNEIEGFPGATILEDPTSARYETITSTGVKEEGLRYEGVFFTSEAAQRALRFYLDEYLEGKEFVYWRRHPEVVVDQSMYLRDSSFETDIDGFQFEKVVTFIATCRVYAE
jgi:hypothetical protein